MHNHKDHLMLHRIILLSDWQKTPRPYTRNFHLSASWGLYQGPPLTLSISYCYYSILYGCYVEEGLGGLNGSPWRHYSVSKLVYTQRNLFGILLNQTKIRLYLTFLNWFGTKRTSVWFQINRLMVNTIWFRPPLLEIIF